MKKKIAAIIIVLAILPGLAFAGGLLQLGVNAQLGFPFESLQDYDNINWDNLFQASNVYYGPELKLNLFFVDIDETLSMQFVDDSFKMRNDLFADIYFSFLFLKANLGLGLQTQLMIDGAPVGYADFQDMMDNSFLSYRAGLGVGLGPVELNLQYILPGKAPFADEGECWIPNPDLSRVSLSLLFDLI